GEARYHMTVYDPQNNSLYPFEVLPTVREPGGKLVPTQYGHIDLEIGVGAGGLSASVIDMARLAAMFSDRSNNPVLSATTIDQMLTDYFNAKVNLKTPDGKQSHGFYGFDWVDILNADNSVYRAEKGGFLPASQTILHFTTGGFGYALAINGNGAIEKWLPAVTQPAESHSWDATDLISPPLGV